MDFLIGMAMGWGLDLVFSPPAFYSPSLPHPFDFLWGPKIGLISTPL